MTRYALTLLVGLLLGWLAQGWRMGEQVADVHAQHETQLRQTAEANAAVIQQQQADRLELESRLSMLDEQRYGELRNAQQNTDQLAADLAAANQRLSVRASCPATGVPGSASSGGVDDGPGARAELHPATAASVIRVVGRADQCQVKLGALQAWAREVGGRD